MLHYGGMPQVELDAWEFKIAGLVPGTGYKVDVGSEDYVHIFYKSGASNNSTTDWEDADELDITNDNVTGVDITLGAGASEVDN